MKRLIAIAAFCIISLMLVERFRKHSAFRPPQRPTSLVNDTQEMLSTARSARAQIEGDHFVLQGNAVSDSGDVEILLNSTRGIATFKADPSGSFVLHLDSRDGVVYARCKKCDGESDRGSVATSPLLLRTACTGVLKCSVTSEGLRAISDAAIFVWDGDGAEPLLAETLPTARTNDAGEAQMLIHTGPVKIAAKHEALAPSWWQDAVVTCGATQTVAVSLTAGGGILGRVALSVLPKTIALYSYRGKFGWSTASVSIDGHFAFTHLPAQAYVLEVFDQQSERSLRRSVFVRDGGVTEVLITPDEENVLLHGFVSLNGIPLPDAKVTVYGEAQSWPSVTTSDGRFRCSVGRRGPHSVVVEKGAQLLTERTIDILSGGDVSIDIVCGSLQVTVVDRGGQAASELIVAVAREQDIEGLSYEETTRAATDSFGSAQFSCLADGSYFMWVLPRRAVNAVWVQRVSVAGPSIQVVPICIPTQSINVRAKVVTLDGLPVEWSKATIFSERGPLTPGFLLQTDANGVLEFRAPTAGVYTATVLDRAGGALNGEFVVEGEQELRLVEVAVGAR